MTSDNSPSPNNSELNSAEVVPRQGISIVWFVPFIALIFGAWLAVKVISEQGTFITIEFENGAGIVPKKTEVRYKGLVTGLVTKVTPSDDLQTVIAEVEMSDKFTNYLTENTLFWLVSADISLQGVSGLDTLISGSYINILPDTGEDAESQEHFVALNEAPALDMATPGLHLTLQTNVLGSISENSPITFKQIPIGYVTGYRYDDASKKIDIHVFIEQAHAHLIKENSLFWNTSGIQVTASLAGGLKVNTDSIASIIAGGIAVDTLSYQEDKANVKNGHSFPLHPDFQSAEMGHEVELTLDWNSGIDNNAAILYQGLTIGSIDSISRIDPAKRKIIAKAKVNPRVVPYLTDQSQFYLVSPQISLNGISNAKTLLTGTYISIRPSLDGKPQNKFKVYKNKPPYKYSEPGLHLVLNATDRNSLQIGSNLYYKQQVVGNVQAIETLSPAEHVIHIHIKPEFQHYVTSSSHFYNASGLKISANLQGIEVAAESLQSMLTGGIAFINHQQDDATASPEKVANGDNFVLFNNEKLAKQRLSFTLTTSVETEVSTNTRLLYRGEEIGTVHEIKANGNIKTLTLGLLPEYQHILTSNTQFWLAKANLSLSGATDTQALFSGSYISFHIGDGEPLSHFTLLAEPPAKRASAKGLQLTLATDNAQVATAGSAVSYRGIKVGQVDNVSLDKSQDNISIGITIDEEHRDLIKANTRFYNASGISLSGGLGDFVVKTESIDAILRGGISFYNPKNNSQAENIEVNELDRFSLFDHIDHAEQAGLAIKIHFNDVAGLKTNTKVIYQEQEIGAIERLVFSQGVVGVTALVLLNDHGVQYAKQGAKFWKVEPEIGLVGSKNVAAILDGAFIGLLPAPSNEEAQSQTQFTALELAPTITELPYGLNIKLTSHRLGSVRVGNPVLYRQVKVGKVIGIDLSATADTVDVYINIANRYAPLVKPNSKFWNTSGVNIEAGIFSGVNIDSESIETLIAGGIAFATPEQDDDIEPTLPNDFILHQALDTDWLEWQPKIAIEK